MPQGPTGIEATAWGAEWITTNSASEFHDRTRSAVETHYKTTLTGNATTSALQPWTTARDALFQTLMSGFSSLNAFIGMLSGAIAGAVGGTLTTIANFMTGLVSDVGKLLTALLNAAGEFIGDIGKGLVDGVVTVAAWLNNLWMTLTGQTGTGKKVSDVSTALSTVTSNANTGKQVAETARDNLNITWNELYDGLDGTTTPVGTQRNATQLKGRGAAVRASAIIGEGYYYAGANILINPGFEDTAFAILNQGVAVTANVATGDVARSGTRSLRLVAAAGNPFSYLSANTTSQVYLPCTAGETYYFECWVRGKSTNTQATAANGIILGITTYDSAKANPVNVTVSFAAGTSYNSDWLKVSGKLLVPAGKAFFTPYVGLNSSTVTNGHTYYFDDVVVREVTDATIADAKAVATNTALYNSPTPLTTVLASAVPQIDGSKINTGTLSEDRITSLSQAKVTGLTTDLGLISTKARDNANLVAGSDFEATTLPWNTAVGYFAVDTAVFNSGTKSLKITGGAIANNTIVYGNGAGTNSLFEVKAGEQFYMELWARRSSDYVNDSTTGPRFRLVRSVGTTIGDILLRVTDIPVADTWVKLTKLVTVPSDGTTAIGFHFSGPPANAAGSVWVDDIVVRRVVVPDAVAALPQSKVPDLWNDLYDGLGGTTGSTGITSAQVRARGATVRGSAKIGEAVYLSASNLLINPGFEDTTFAILNNGVASTDVARSGTRSLRLIAASGSPYSMLAANTTGQVYLPCVPTETYYLECWVYGKTTNTQTTAVNGLIFGIQVYTASKVFISNVQLTFNGGTSRNGGWAKLSGKVQVPANAAFFTPFIQLSSGVLTNGETYYFDDVVVREVTDATIADGKAVVADGKAVSINQALYNADTPAAAVLASSIAPLDSSKITTGNFAQARVTGLGTDLGAAKSIGLTALAKGSNLASNPGFESDNVYIGVNASGVFSTAQKRSGTRSFKMTGYTYRDLFANETAYVRTACNAGDVYYLEIWVYGEATNVTNGSQVWLQADCYNSSGVRTEFFGPGGTTVPGLVLTNAQSSATRGNWTQISGYLPIPANTIDFTVTMVQTDPSNTVGGAFSYYWDDFKCFRVTESATTNQALYSANVPAATILASKVPPIDGSKINTGTLSEDRIASLSAGKITSGTFVEGRIPELAQAKITSLQDDLAARSTTDSADNLCNNPGFETAGLYTGVNATRANDVAPGAPRTGNWCAKVTQVASAYSFIHPIVKRSGSAIIPTSPGDVYYFECWIKGLTTNAAAPGGIIWLQTTYWLTGGTTSNNALTTVPANNYHNNGWTFYSGYLPAMPVDVYQVQFYLAFSNNLPGGNIYYVDDMKLYRVTDQVKINQALYTANIPGPVVLSSKIQDLDASKITGGTLADGRIPSLAAGKITSGTFGSTLIPELAQAKITGLGTDLGNRVDYTAYAAYLSGGTGNLVTNPSFEDTTQYINAATYSTAYARSGTRSAKIVGTASNVFLDLVSNKTGPVYINGAANSKFYLECYVRADPANTILTGATVPFNFSILYYTTANVYINSVGISATFSQIGNGTDWFQLSGIVTLPNDSTIAKIRPMIFTTATGNGQSYYFDDVDVKEITESVDINQALYAANIPGPVVLSNKIQDLDASKITGGVLTDGRIPSLAAGKITSGTFGSTLIPTLDRSKLLNPDFSNALQDGGFETGTNGTSTGSWGTSGGGVIATIADPKVGGTKVLSVASSGAILDTNMLPTIPVSPGEVWYGECWVRKTTAGGTGSYQLGSTVAKDGGGLQYPSFLTADVSTLTQNVWTKISGFITIPDAINQLTVRPSVRNSVAAGTTIQFDNVVVRKATQYELADSAVTGAKIAALAVDNGKIANLAVTGEKTTGLDGSKITSGSVPEANIAQLSQAKVTGLPDTLLPVSQTLIEHAQDIVDLKATREVTVNQGKTISVSFVQLPNANDLPTTGSQTWSTQYLTGSGPTFGITSGKAAWKSSGTRTAKVLYRGAGTRQVFVSGTGGTFTLTVGANTTAALAWNASAATVQTALTGLASVGAGNATVTGTITTLPGLAITLNSGLSGALSLASSVTGGVAALSDGGETTLTDYQSLRGVLADPPGIFGNESSGFTALARVSQDSNSYVFARAYWASLGNLRGKIGYANNVGGTAVETVWQDNIPLTWSTELTFRLGVDDNPRAYQVFSGTTLVTRYDEGYTDFAALTAIASKATGRTYVDNTGNRLTVTGTGGTFTLTVGGVTTAAIAFNATAATVATALNTALNTALATTGVVYATVTGTAANTAGSPGGLVAKFSSKVPGLTIGNANLTVNAASITGGTATVANRYTWSGTAFVPSAATSGAGAASPLGPTSRRFGAEVRTSGSNASGTISSVAVSDNPPVVYAGSVARMSRLSTGNVGSLSTTDTALPNNFFDDVDFESLDIDASLSTGSFTVTKSKMYLVTARVKLREAYAANLYLNLQVWDGGYSTYNLTQRGGSLWAADTGNFAANPTSGFVLTGTWLQYLTAGSSVRLSANCDRNSYTTAFTGGTLETYFSISALQ